MFTTFKHHELHCQVTWISSWHIYTVKQKMFVNFSFISAMYQMIWPLWPQVEVCHFLNYTRLWACRSWQACKRCEFLFLCDFSAISVMLGQMQSPAGKMRVLLMTSTSVVRRHDGWMGTVVCWRTLCLCHSSKQSRASGKLAVSNLLANILSFSIIHGKSPIPKTQISLMYCPVETNSVF